MRSISSPNISIRTEFSLREAGNISITSPRTLNVPRVNSISFLIYCILISFSNILLREISSPTRNESTREEYSSGDPRPYIQLTLETIITSSRSNREDVALWRSLSISSFTDESFSIYVSVEGT